MAIAELLDDEQPPKNDDATSRLTQLPLLGTTVIAKFSWTSTLQSPKLAIKAKIWPAGQVRPDTAGREGQRV